MAFQNQNSTSSASGGGSHKYGQGAVLTPSSNTITPTDPFHHVAAGTVATIATTNIDTSVPNELVLVADGAITISSGGNITGPTKSLSTNDAICYVLDGSTWRETDSAGATTWTSPNGETLKFGSAYQNSLELAGNLASGGAYITVKHSGDIEVAEVVLKNDIADNLILSIWGSAFPGTSFGIAYNTAAFITSDQRNIVLGVPTGKAVIVGTNNIERARIDSVGFKMASGSSTDGAASSLQTAAGNGETINTASIGMARYKTNGSARTGVILQSGTYDGQVVTVINEDTTAGNSITFAAVATSKVANGVTTVINGLQGRRFIWSANAATPAWYELK